MKHNILLTVSLFVVLAITANSQIHQYEVVGRSMAQVTGEPHIYNTFFLLDTGAVETCPGASLPCDPVLLIGRSVVGDFHVGEMVQLLFVGTDSVVHI